VSGEYDWTRVMEAWSSTYNTLGDLAVKTDSLELSTLGERLFKWYLTGQDNGEPYPEV
jgi:hypothetical protein